MKVVSDFEALPLDAKLKAYPEITASLDAAKEAWMSGAVWQPMQVRGAAL